MPTRSTVAACNGKVQYPDAKVADNAMELMQHRFDFVVVPGKRLCVYFCKHCRRFHIGNTRSRAKKP